VELSLVVIRCVVCAVRCCAVVDRRAGEEPRSVLLDCVPSGWY
jgi:hypothetical protein